MPPSGLRGGLIREILVDVVLLALALWAAAAMLARFFLGNPHFGWIPVLPLLFSPFEALAFPILAAVMGFAFAQGSAVHTSSVNYKLGEIYDRLACAALERLQLPPDGVAFIQRVADYLDRNQRARTMSAEARRAIVQLAEELRALARQLQPTAPETAARYSELANSVSSAVHTRRLRVEVESDQPHEPLHPGREYTLCLKFEPDQSGSTLPADFGSRTDLTLALYLFGTGLICRDSAVQISLPKWGESTQATTVMKVLETGSCRLRVVVTTTDELEILQTYSIEFEADRAVQPVLAG